MGRIGAESCLPAWPLGSVRAVCDRRIGLVGGRPADGCGWSSGGHGTSFIDQAFGDPAGPARGLSSGISPRLSRVIAGSTGLSSGAAASVRAFADVCSLGSSASGQWDAAVLDVPVTAALALASVPFVAADGSAWGLGGSLGDRVESWLYDDPVIFRQQSRYQRLVLTRRRQDVRLYLDGQLQFSSLDEYRYHEALVHPAMACHGSPRRVLLLGAGDGLALREILRWPSVQQVDLIELDPSVVSLARRHPLVQRLHQGSLDDPRLTVHHGDAFQLLERLEGSFDVVIADFPDPSTPALARLYSVGFYGRLQRRIERGGVFVTQASTPFFTPDVLASIEASLQQLRWSTRGYAVTVPSFGPWGFVLAQWDQEVNTSGFAPLPFQGRWISDRWLKYFPELPDDLRPDPGALIRPNRLVQPVLVDYQRNGRWPWI